MPKKILFFIESLHSGGKERRFVELLVYLKKYTDMNMLIVLTEETIHYKSVLKMDIPIKIIKRKFVKKDPSLFLKFFKIAKQFQPDIIHTWGVMTTFYAIPSRVILRRPLVANLIADASRHFRRFSASNLYFKAGCIFSDAILANSEAGLRAYGIKCDKAKVIYNGVCLDRFNDLETKLNIREQLKVKTKFMIVMVATFSKFKDYFFFLDIAKEIFSLRSDVTFVCVGDGELLQSIHDRILNENINNVILAGRRSDVESIVSSSDIGVLITNWPIHSEGISNSIIEYMALGKPVITTDIAGGSCEIIEDGKSGFIINKCLNVMVEKINMLLDDENLHKTMGEKGKEIIEAKFSVETMGANFLNSYRVFTDI